MIHRISRVFALLALTVAMPAIVGAQSFVTEWPRIRAHLNSPYVSGMTYTNSTSSATGYVYKTTGNVFHVVFPAPVSPVAGSNAWAWVITNSNAFEYAKSRTNAWNIAGDTATWASNLASSLAASLPAISNAAFAAGVVTSSLWCTPNPSVETIRPVSEMTVLNTGLWEVRHGDGYLIPRTNGGPDTFWTVTNGVLTTKGWL